MAARAQIGSGWTQQTFSERLEFETNDILNTISPPPASFTDNFLHYDNTGGVETFQLKTSASNRAEIRANDDYSSGSRQFQATITVATNTTDGECIHQVFNGSTGPYLLLRQNYLTASTFTVTVGGTLPSGDKGGVIFTNNYGVPFQLNSINSLVDGNTYVYYNGTLVWSGANPGGTFYTKYGCYGSHDNAHPSNIQFTNVLLFSGGTTNDAFSGTWEIQNVTSSKVLNQAGSLTNGSPISQWTEGTSDNPEVHLHSHQQRLLPDQQRQERTGCRRAKRRHHQWGAADPMVLRLLRRRPVETRPEQRRHLDVLQPPQR